MNIDKTELMYRIKWVASAMVVAVALCFIVWYAPEIMAWMGEKLW
jgi:hypothetical protein